MKRGFVASALCVLVTAVIVGIVFVATRPAQSLTIGTFSKALGNTPYYVARHFRWFEDDAELKGLRIIYKEFNDRPSISDAFSAGELQILFSGDAPAILCRAQGSDFRITNVSGNAAQEVLVRTELPVKTVEELKGHSVAVQRGTSSQYALLKILKAHKLTQKDITLRYVNPDEAKTAFETSQLDAWAVWAPFVEQEVVNKKGRVVVGSKALINSVMSVENKFLSGQERKARAIAGITERAKKWMVDNPSKAQRIAADELGLELKVVETAWPKFNWQAALDDEIIDDLQDKAIFLADEDLTRASRRLDVRKELIHPLAPPSGDGQ